MNKNLRNRYFDRGEYAWESLSNINDLELILCQNKDIYVLVAHIAWLAHKCFAFAMER